MIIDAHTHVYPDKIAGKAGKSIGEFYELPVLGLGTTEDLILAMNKANISKSLICSVAVTPNRVMNINNFLGSAVSENPRKFIGFGSVHPFMELSDLKYELTRLKTLGLVGIKIHPDFQKFLLDCDESIEMFKLAAEMNFPFLIHVGDYRYQYSEPKRLKNVLKKISDLKVICAHFGGWSIWNEGWKELADCDNVWVDTSSSLYSLDNRTAVNIINRYDEDKVLYGTDYPMWMPELEVNKINSLQISDERKEKIFSKNIINFFKNFNIKIKES